LNPELLNRNCFSCNSPIETAHTYCSNCGKRQDEKYSAVYNEKFVAGRLYAILAFYLLQLIVCVVAHFADYFDTYPNHLILDISTFIITLLFFILNFKYVAPLLTFRNVKLKTVLIVISLACFASVGVSYLVDLTNTFIFNEEYTYVYAYRNTDNKLLWMLLTSALMPAIDEEIAFRGVFYQQLKSFLKPKQLVWVTSILFTTIHLSALSVLWILPFAIIIANLRRKHQTLWYGIFIHFTFNATALILDYLQNKDSVWLLE